MSRHGSVLALLVFSLSATACHEGSSGDSIALPSTSTSNLGLALGYALGSGGLQLFIVPESQQGRDLDGDGDQLDGDGLSFDGVVHVLDLDRGSVTNTGLALGVTPAHGSEIPARPVASADETLAFGVSERETGGLDRNGDGDADDIVLAFYDARSASVTDLGLAASNVVAGAHLLAFDATEIEQNEDLDGDGLINASVPFVHDLRTGETWSLGPHGSSVIAVDGDLVALAAREGVLGDRNGDGDASDAVFELYDVGTRTVQHVGLALQLAIGGLAGVPFTSASRWALHVPEDGQGADLDGDGDELDLVAFVYDPLTRTKRNLGERIVTKQPGIEPFVLFDRRGLDASSAPFVWFYDLRTDLLTDTGLRGLFVLADGERVAVMVSEADQGQDLDHNGALESSVPVLYDLASGRTQNLGIDVAGGRSIHGDGGGLILFSRESAAQRDWNRDGDRDDFVLFTWDERGAELVNTRMEPRAVSFGEGVLLVVVDEARDGRDRNDDGDALDSVIATYDLRTRRIGSLGLATPYLFEGVRDTALIPVEESEQGKDLNGDGDQDDYVLHLARILPQA